MNFRSTKIEPSFLYALLLPVFLFPLLLKGQSPVIKGKVFGAEHDPLPFVHIRFDQGNVGTTSNIDGNFTFPFNVKRLNFSYIGYKTLELPVEVTKDGTLEIEMIPDNTLLSTVEVHPGKNPANTIMERVLEMSDRNNPEHFGSYQYSSYHKFWLSTELADGSQKSGKSPISQSELTKLQKRFESNHMLLIETLSRKKFLQPNHENEEILSSSVSGLKKETFFLLANQLQSFSVYRENFRMLSHDYLSPISKSALRNYAFVLEDTLMTDKGDSLFLIRFHPAKGRNFDGLKGFLQINTHGYAVQSVIAEPSQIEKREIYASIWQHYDQLESGQWFPSELNAAINFKIISSLEIDSLKKRKPLLLSVTANSRSYLFDRSVNLPLEAKSFPKYGITVAEGGRDTLSAAGKFRFIPLTPKDSATYQYLDSLGNKIRLNQKVRLIHALSLGTIPIGPVSLNFMYLFGYNINEGYKLGLGVETNRSFSRHFAAGSYFTYGTKDGEFFYGEWLRAFPTGRSDFKIQLDYRNMKREYGVEELLTDYNIFEPEYFRSLLITNMYHTKCYTASVEFRPVEPLNLKIFTDNATEIRLPYGNFSERRWTPFDLTRAGLEIRYSPGITFLNDRDELIQNTPPKADLYFGIIQGMKWFKGAYQFTKLDSKFKFNLRISPLGNTTVMIRAGKIFKDAPMTEWFHGYGSYSGDFTLLAHYAFATMRLNEFSADQYAALHIRHNFGSGFIPSWYFIRPELTLAQNIGFGSLAGNYRASSGVPDFRKGYYESGIELNRILNTRAIGLGFGTYYRYGPYRIEVPAQNFAYKFTINFKF